MFTSYVIDHYYGITTEDVHQLPTVYGMSEVARFLYGQDNAWPLPRRTLSTISLKDFLLILNLFVSHNIDLSTHRTTINKARTRFLYHLAHERKINLESYIYTLITNLCFQTDKRHTSIFSALISGICEAERVQISTAELVVKLNRPINRFALENARRHTAQVARTATAVEDQPQEGHPVAL
ncbi:Uncharacterized protein Adt_14181 [Abeliophyllum distichum]|uniref:Uncharacterized protein n=1 Tax=Abeliophyllum distichum TaxID=126358 RepID=A0ABD1TYX2_9LAMI